MATNVTQKTLISLYAQASAAGLWESAIMRRVFAALYFTYKKHLEDSYALLVQKHPEIFIEGNIIDVGANIGYTSILFAPYLKGVSKIYAFEPEKKNFALLQEIVQRKKLSHKIVPVLAAVGSEPGTVKLWYNPIHAGDHRITTDAFDGEHTNENTAHTQEYQKVSVFTLDAFAEKTFPSEQVSFIKIDVQGYETEVCKGMELLLANHPETIIGIEYGPEGIRTLGFSPEALLEFFQSRGYEPYLLTRKTGLTHTTYAELATDPIGGYTDLIFAKRTLVP